MILNTCSGPGPENVKMKKTWLNPWGAEFSRRCRCNRILWCQDGCWSVMVSAAQGRKLGKEYRAEGLGVWWKLENESTFELGLCSGPTDRRRRLWNHREVREITGASHVALVVKNPPANAGDIRDMCSIPGSWRFPRGRHGNILQYSGLENPMNKGAWCARVTKSQTRLSD